MKIHPLALLLFCGAAVLHAQTPAPVVVTGRTPDELDRLVAPIALYPDALVALILPATTAPTDLVLAARFLAVNGPAANVDGQPWDESVRALAHYPDVVKWMDANLEWTQTLGGAFMQQPADVMQAVQRLRARARAQGALIDTPQQQIVMENDAICIVPAQPDVIYVPIYDPELVFWGRGPLFGRPYLTFGLGFSIGVWLNFDCDWHGRNVWVRQHPRDWDRRREPVRPPTFWRPDNDGHAWRPLPDRPRFFPPMRPDRRPDAIPRPRPMQEGTPDRSRPPFNTGPDSHRPEVRDRGPGPGQPPGQPSGPRGDLRRDGNDRPNPMPRTTGDQPRPPINAAPDSHRPEVHDRAAVPPRDRPSPSQVNAPGPGQPSGPRGDSRRDGGGHPGPDRGGPQRQAPSAPAQPVVRPAAPPSQPPPPSAPQQGNNNPPANGDRDRDQK